MACTGFIWPETPSNFGQVYIIAITTFTIVIAVPGNLLTAFIIVRNVALRSEPAYLLICSVCIADVLVSSVTQPFFIYTILHGSHRYITIDRLYFAVGWLSSVSSTFGIIAITIDRYIYIVHPLRYQNFMTKKKAYTMITIVWVVAVSFAVLPLLYHNAMVLHTIVLAVSILLAAIMTYTYSQVYRQVTKTKDKPTVPKTINNNNNSVNLKYKRQNQATKTVLLVVVAYIGCWFPWVIVSFIIALHNFPVANLQVFSKESLILALHWIFLGLGYSNSAFNVFIYSRKNKMLKKAISRFFVSLNIPMVSRCFAENRTRKESRLDDLSVSNHQDSQSKQRAFTIS